MWTVSLSADDDGGGGMIRSLDGATDYQRFEVPQTAGDYPSHTTRIVTFVTDNADDSVDGNGHSEFGFEIVIDADVDAVYVTSVGCYEMPLDYVQPSDLAGSAGFVDESKCESGKPIYDDEQTPPEVGPAAVAYAAVSAETNAKRSAMAAWWFTQAIAESGSTFAPAFGGNVPLLARRRYSTDGAGNREIRVWVYAIGVGQIRLTMTTGDTATLTWSYPSNYAWQTATISCDAESLATLGTDGGLRSSTRDELLVEMRTTDVVIGLRCVCAGEID
jgi:hypothetical protein